MSISMRWVVAVIVVVGVGHRVYRERARLAEYDFSFDPTWLLVSGICYVAGLSNSAAFWWLAMRDQGGRPSWTSTLAAYFAGHLGKYVPGKALVLVIRATMVRGPGVEIADGAITAAHETLLMMATGAVVAAGALCFVETPGRATMLMAATVLATGLGAIASPPAVSGLGRLALKPFGNVGGGSHRPCRWRTVAIGTAIIALGWLLMGLSLAALQASVGDLTRVVQDRGWPGTIALLTATVSFATTVGFISLLPGGLGSREWVLMETLGPIVGADHAVVATVMLRLVWIVAEVVAAGVFWMIDRKWNQSNIQTN